MRPRIVIVEDGSELLDALCTVLQDEGFAVSGFTYPDLTRMLQSGPADLFLMDLKLPGATGIEVADWLRSHGFSDTPIIGISASSDQLHQALRSNLFQELLPKPFDLTELIGAVRRHVVGSTSEGTNGLYLLPGMDAAR